ncbi:NUDIX hydrolase [Jatrophihabitans sp.]|uniref:NUDIX hydrolase n=1 Tax=Jatrophihabitans sp. TaxID=1932789 RepID=UPI0030C689CC|nr:hydrolase [Jatrophihabitans sp.]
MSAFDAVANADVPVRDASTVVLLRDSDQGLETWLLTRVRGMAFAAGASVFPGGRVDEADAELPFAPGGVALTASRFGCDEARARVLLGAAVRETFEETGVLLSIPVADLSGARTDVEAGRIGFGQLLRSNDLVLDAEGLRPWSRWITPVGEVRRYDTHFFVGALPDGAEAQDVTSESSSASWVGVGAALEAAQRGERIMLPPTLATLASLVPFETVAEALAASEGRSLEAVQPKITAGPDGGYRADLPDGSSFLLPRATGGGR